MTGIYKIESPTGSVYIGQSIDIDRRFLLYRRIKAVKKQPLIERSLLKHGHANHIFSILCLLPDGIDKATLSRYEQVYMDQHRECGFRMMNLSAASESPYGCKRTEEQKQKQSERMKGKTSPRRGAKLTQEQKDHLRKINTGKPFSEVARQKLKGRSVWNKGLKGLPDYRKNTKPSEVTKEKLRQANLGKKLSPESIRKREETRKANGNNKQWSEEARRRRSELYKGRKFGHSAETKMKMSIAAKVAIEKKRNMK